jgi:anti-anti-sigma regulatory factor
MLKITRLPDADSRTVILRLDGQVAGPWVDTLRRACDNARPAADDPGGMVLDLSGVSYIDANGLALFHELTANGAELTNGSMYVAEQLKEVVHASE